MAISRAKKEELVAELEVKLKNAKMVVFTDYMGLKMDDLSAIRREGRKQQVEYKIFKNTLVKLAAKNAGVSLPEDLLRGPLAIAFGQGDGLAPAKIIAEAARGNENLKIKAGIFEGRLISEAEVKDLALIPGREELYAKLVGSVSAPLSGMLNVLSGNIRGLVNVLDAYQKSKA